MREDESNWFSRWDEDLPSPEELTPLSQTLITPDLALAFDIPTPHNHNHNNHDQFHRALFHQQNHNHHPQQFQPQQTQTGPNSGEFETSSAGGGGSGGGGGGNGVDEPARTLKRPRLVWTPQLHKRFVDAVAHLGIKNAVPKSIMQLMSVDGLTRENVASHLQKYRLYLKRMQSMNSNGSGGIGGGGGDLVATSGDPATDHLFASGPVPAHFLNRGNLDHIGSYMAAAPPPSQVALASGAIHHGHQMGVVDVNHYQNQYNSHHRQMGGFGGHFEHQLMGRGGHIGVRMNGGVGGGVHSSFSTGGGGGFGDDVESGAANGRKVLTLFPTGDD